MARVAAPTGREAPPPCGCKKASTKVQPACNSGASPLNGPCPLLAGWSRAPARGRCAPPAPPARCALRRETLMMQAHLRLPSDWGQEGKERYVDALIKRLGLAKAADTIVGDAKTRGLSGAGRGRPAARLGLRAGRGGAGRAGGRTECGVRCLAGPCLCRIVGNSLLRFAPQRRGAKKAGCGSALLISATLPRPLLRPPCRRREEAAGHCLRAHLLPLPPLPGRAHHGAGLVPGREGQRGGSRAGGWRAAAGRGRAEAGAGRGRAGQGRAGTADCRLGQQAAHACMHALLRRAARCSGDASAQGPDHRWPHRGGLHPPAPLLGLCHV